MHVVFDTKNNCYAKILHSKEVDGKPTVFLEAITLSDKGEEYSQSPEALVMASADHLQSLELYYSIQLKTLDKVKGLTNYIDAPNVTKIDFGPRKKK